MVPTSSFPSALVRRAQRLAVPAALVGVVLGAVCCGKVIIDGASGQGAGGAGGTGGAGGALGVGGEGGGVAGDGGCVVALTSGSGGLEHTIQCFAPPAGSCPSQYAAAMYITPDPCTYLTLVDCGPVVENGACCYVVTEQPHPCGT